MILSIPECFDAATELWISAEVALPSAEVQARVRRSQDSKPMEVIQHGLKLDQMLDTYTYHPMNFSHVSQDIGSLVKRTLTELRRPFAMRHVVPFPFGNSPTLCLCGDFYAAVDVCTTCLIVQDFVLEKGLIEGAISSDDTPFLRWARKGLTKGGTVEPRPDGTWDWARCQPTFRDENIYSSIVVGGDRGARTVFAVPTGHTIPVLSGNKRQKRKRKPLKGRRGGR